MKISFHKKFFKSLRKTKRRQTWWYKTYEFLRYDIIRFCRNAWLFRRELRDFYHWDYVYNLKILKRSLELTCTNIENGNEIASYRLKKVAKMKRAIELIDNVCKDNFIDRAEEILKTKVNSDNLFKLFENPKNSDLYEMEEESEEVKTNNRKIFDLAEKLENEEWEELWQIVRGREDEFVPSSPDDHEKTLAESEQWFDGSGMKGWWN